MAQADYWGYQLFDPHEVEEEREDESLWPDWDPARISLTTACKRYSLKKTDLSELTDIVTRPNPYRMFSTVKLYLIDEVEALSERKQAEKAAHQRYLQEHAEEIAEDKAERARAAKQEAADQAEQIYDSYKAVGGAGITSEDGGNTRLPQECLGLVIDKLMDLPHTSTQGTGQTLELCGKARELANLSMVCKDFYLAVHQFGLPALADEASAEHLSAPLPPAAPTPSRLQQLGKQQAQLRKQLQGLQALPGPTSKKLGWAFWDVLVRDPVVFYGTYRQTEVKEGVKLLHGKLTGLKQELVVRLMQGLGLKQPAAAPAKLLAALHAERLQHQLKYGIRPRG